MIDSLWNPSRSAPTDDPRSVDELVSAALCDRDEDVYWNVVYALQREEAIRACSSTCGGTAGLSSTYTEV
ncbi:MAG: hypothetical protein ACLQIB_35760 [Isosphaeraceae bacterium]